MIHIVSEIVILVGIIFYFNQKHKKTLKHIEDLAQRLEDQEDLIQKHEEIIQKLVGVINTQYASNQNTTKPPEKYVNIKKVSAPQPPPPAAPKKTFKKVSVQKPESPKKVIIKPEPALIIKPHKIVEEQVFDLNPRVIELDDDIDEEVRDEVELIEEDLDAELADELEELEQSETLDLKKSTI